VAQPFDPINTSDLKAADDLLAVRQWSWATGLSEDEAGRLADYKGRLGRPMNRLLRGELQDAVLARQASVLRGALARARAPADMILHRAIGPLEAALYRRLQRGGEVAAAAFLSASISHEVAHTNARAEQGIVIEILVTHMQHGVGYINPFPTYRYPQYEALLNAGTRLKVLQADLPMIRLEVADDRSDG